MQWLRPQSKRELLEIYTGNPVDPLGIIDPLKLKAEVKRLSQLLKNPRNSKEKKEDLDVDKILSIIATNPKYRKNVISDDAMQVHQLLSSEGNNENKLQGIIVYLSKVQLQRSLSGQLDNRLAACIEEELVKNPKVSNPEFRDKLFECYSRSYGAIHDRYLIKEDSSSYTREDALAFVREHLNFMSKIPKKIEDFDLHESRLPSMAKLASLLGLLDPNKDIEEIKACKKYLSLCQTLISRKILEEKPEIEPKITTAIHDLLQNITQISMSNHYVRLEEKDSGIQQANMSIKGTSYLLSAASVASLLFFSPAAPALGLGGALTAAISTGMSQIKFGANEEEITRSLSIPKHLTINDTENKLKNLRSTIQKSWKKNSILSTLEAQLQGNELYKNLDSNLARIIHEMLDSIGQYKHFILESKKSLENLQRSFKELLSDLKSNEFNYEAWEKLYEINQSLESIESQLQTKRVAVLNNYEAIKKDAQIILEGSKENEVKAFFR